MSECFRFLGLNSLHTKILQSEQSSSIETFPKWKGPNLDPSDVLVKEFCACAQSLQSCLTLCNPMDCSQPGSSVHGILQARILERVAIPFSRGSSWPRGWTCVSCISCIAGRFFSTEPLRKLRHCSNSLLTTRSCALWIFSRYAVGLPCVNSKSLSKPCHLYCTHSDRDRVKG